MAPFITAPKPSSLAESLARSPPACAGITAVVASNPVALPAAELLAIACFSVLS
jgi:hypothetical protein